jgi:hypothetical protein
VTVVAVLRDLMLYSRIEAAARVSGAALLRVDSPSDVPPDADLVLVDWGSRDTSWTDALRALAASGARVVLFGPHTDLEAHAAARDTGLGPMKARSKLMASLSELMGRSGS